VDDYLQTGSRKYLGLFLVLAFHVVVVFIFASGLAYKAKEFIEDVQADIIKEPPPPPPDVEPPPPPELIEPPPFVPPPEINIESTISTETAITQTQSTVPASGPTIGVRLDPKRPPTKPDYPASSKRLEQEGTVTLLLYVTEDGRVADAKVDRSSGYPALDQAALRESRTWRFLPAQTQGKPVAAWYRISVTFNLEDA
jgi:protein TonB